MRPKNFLRNIAIGAASGAIATFPMTAAMEALRYALLHSEPGTFPPRQVALGIMNQMGLKKPLRPFGEPGVMAITAATHFGFGGAAGGVYGALATILDRGNRRRLRIATGMTTRSDNRIPAAHGAAFGILVWSGSYFGWLPALGIFKPQGDYPIEKNTILALSHAVWGAAMGVMYHHQTQKMDNRKSVPPAHRKVARHRRA